MTEPTSLRWRRWGTLGAYSLIWTSKWHIAYVGLGGVETARCGIRLYCTMPKSEDGVIEPGSPAPKRSRCCKRCLASVAERYWPT